LIDYRILPEQKLVVFCNWGVTPVEEVLELRQALRSNSDFSPDYDAIVDSTLLDRQ